MLNLTDSGIKRNQMERQISQLTYWETRNGRQVNSIPKKRRALRSSSRASPGSTSMRIPPLSPLLSHPFPFFPNNICPQIPTFPLFSPLFRNSNSWNTFANFWTGTHLSKKVGKSHRGEANFDFYQWSQENRAVPTIGQRRWQKAFCFFS